MTDRKASEVERRMRFVFEGFFMNSGVELGELESLKDKAITVAVEMIAAVRAEQQARLKGCLCNCHDAPNEMFPKQHDDCLICMKGLVEEAEALGRIAAAQQGGHVALARDREWSNRLESQDTLHPDSPDLDLAIAWYVSRRRS